MGLGGPEIELRSLSARDACSDLQSIMPIRFRAGYVSFSQRIIVVRVTRSSREHLWRALTL